MKVIYMHTGPTFEAILIRCTLGGQTRDILGTYWPGTYHGDITDWRRIFRLIKHPLIMIGDMNPHHRGLFNSPHTDTRGLLVAQLMEEYNLIKISHGITYQRPHQAGSELDVALITDTLVGEFTC